MRIFVFFFIFAYNLSVINGVPYFLDQAPHYEKKEKKSTLAKKKKKQFGERSEPRGSLGMRKPSPGCCSARRFFSYLTPFFALLRHCHALWSLSHAK